MTTDRVRLRWFEPDDLQQLCDLHRACLPGEAWAAEDFGRFAARPGAAGVVKVLSGADRTVYGSLLYEVGLECVLVRRVCVWPDYRGRGYGALLVGSLTSPRVPHGRTLVQARVKPEDAAAARFFGRTARFTPVGLVDGRRLFAFDRRAAAR